MQDRLWTGHALAAAIGAEVRGTLPGSVSGVSIDTRTLNEGEVFFAIRGDNSDGHDYVAAAFEKGATAAVVSDERAGSLGDAGPLLLVPDVLVALEALGRLARERTLARVVAVTGSVGKTGTKEMLRMALSKQGPVHASVASYNNHWGVPLTLARMPAQTRFGVFEIGMNHAGEITPLAKMVNPDIAIITTVEAVHLEHFPSIEAIADAKAEIFFGLKPGGYAVLNRDSRFFERLAIHATAAGARVVSFGEHENADARLLRSDAQGRGSVVSAHIRGVSINYRLGAPGRHLVMNSLAALLAAKLMGADVASAALALGEFDAPKGRGQRIGLTLPDGKALLIDESYNANPASMRAALAVLGTVRPPEGGRRIAVLGDMLELGRQADQLHEELSDALAEAQVNVLYAAGRHMRALYQSVSGEMRGGWAINSEDLKERVMAAVRPGDVIMVKGSFGSRMGLIVEALTARFGPREDQEGAAAH